jgi:hypothetical protein
VSDPAEYADTGGANRGSLDEKGVVFRSKIGTYQRIRTVDAWLIDNDCEDDEEGSASGADSDEDTPGASAMAEQSCRPQEPSSQDHGDGSGSGAAAPGCTHKSPGGTGGIRHSRAVVGEQGRAADVEGEYAHPTAGETAAEMVSTLNMILRSLRDQGQEELEVDKFPNGGPIYRQDFLEN